MRQGRTFGFVLAMVLVSVLLFCAAAGAQETTGPDTASPEATTPEPQTETGGEGGETTAGAAADANGVDRGAGAFRCELFLRVEEGDGFDRRDLAGWRQYFGGDEDLLLQRIEECREREVLVGTIPDRKLPKTGGPPLLLAPWLLALVAAGAALLRRP